MRLSLGGLAAMVAVAAVVSGPIKGEELLWSGYYTGIWRANTDGSNAHQVLDVGSDVVGGLASDLEHQVVYYTRHPVGNTVGSIQMCNWDGSGVQTVVTGGRYGAGISLDGQGHLYYNDGTDKSIRRCDLDGSNEQTIYVNTDSTTTDLAVDPVGGKIYWTCYYENLIQRANLDGSGAETILATALDTPRYINIDLTHRKLYWSEHQGGGIQRCDMDGTNVEVVWAKTSTTDNIAGIALDPVKELVYWQHFDWNAGHVGHIRVVGFDGSNMHNLTSQGTCVYPGDVVLIAEPATVQIDVRPGSWPNPLNAKSRGVLPLAVCGTEDLDVTTIDPGTILLGREGFDLWLAPLRWSVEDVATPYDDGQPGGHDLDGDGFPDLALKFSTEELAALFGLGGEPGNTIPLTLTGTLTDEAGGLDIEGLDWIWVLRTGDANLDGFVDIQDFGILNANFAVGAGWSEGDFNEDGLVDIQDFAALKGHFGEGAAQGAAAAVPEPATLSLLAVGGLVLLKRKSRQS